MTKNLGSTFSFITLILSLFFFVLPALVGNSAIVALFLISFVLLIVSFFTSKNSLTDEAKNYSKLSLFTLIISIIFFLFLIIGALLA